MGKLHHLLTKKPLPGEMPLRIIPARSRKRWTVRKRKRGEESASQGVGGKKIYFERGEIVFYRENREIAAPSPQGRDVQRDEK